MNKSKLLCSLFVGSLLIGGLASCQYFPSLLTSQEQSSEETKQTNRLTYIKMRINPEIELVIDENEVVISVNAINEDCEVVLSNIELVGLTAEEAAELFTNTAIELGYIDIESEDATVYVLADAEDEEYENELENEVIDKVDCVFDKNGIFGKGSKEALEDLKVLAETWEVSLKEAKMINRILELYPEMTLEEILELSFEERIQLIKEEKEKRHLNCESRKEFKDAIDQLKEEYKELFELRKELKNLELKLSDETLSDEEKVTLQEEYDQKKLTLETLEAEFEQAIKLILEEKQAENEEYFKKVAEDANNRKEEYKEKIRKHFEKFEENMEKIEKEIKEWREGHKGK